MLDPESYGFAISQRTIAQILQASFGGKTRPWSSGHTIDGPNAYA